MSLSRSRGYRPVPGEGSGGVRTDDEVCGMCKSGTYALTLVLLGRPRFLNETCY